MAEDTNEGSGSAAVQDALKTRRDALEATLTTHSDPGLGGVVEQVEQALERLETGEFGLCTVCHEPMDGGRLLSHPLARVCLECLNPAQRQDLERDLETAGHIQAALLPERSLGTDAWRFDYHYAPAGAVSGDYIDLIRLPEEKAFYFLFGDVAGKGVSASILTAYLHALFRSLVSVRLPLKELMCRANRLFSESTMSNSYATMVVGRVETDGRVEIANAGHLPTLWIGGHAVKSLAASGFPLGMFPSLEIESHTIELGAHDSLLLFTDGLTELSDPDQEEYGQDRVASAASRVPGRSPSETIRNCLEDLRAFGRGRSAQDDLTLMVLQRGEPLQPRAPRRERERVASACA